MSRGAGRLQRLVLQIVLAQDEPITVNEVAWRAAEADGAVRQGTTILGKIREGELKRPFYSALLRSTERLVKTGALASETRKLQTLEEVVRVFPYKTLRLPIRALRQHFLPVVTELASQRSRVVTAAGIEEELLLRALDDLARVAACTERWRSSSAPLIRVYQAATSSDQRDIALRLLVKGTRYFDSTSELWIGKTRQAVSLAETEPLEQLIAIGKRVLSIDLQNLRRLLEYAIPSSSYEQRNLKDMLFRVGDFYQGRTVGLKEDVSNILAEREPLLVHNLPGHKPAKTSRRAVWSMEELRPRFSPLLRQILDRHVFAPFTFLRAAKSA